MANPRTAGQARPTLQSGHSQNVNAVAYSPDGTRLASAGKDLDVRLWDAATGRLLATLRGHAKEVWSLAWSPDGRWLASGDLAGTLKIWDTRAGDAATPLTAAPPAESMQVGEWVVTPIVQQHPISSLAFSRGGTALAVGTYRRILMLETGTWQQKGELGGLEAVVTGLDFSPDGMRLASSDEAMEIRIWDMTTGRSGAPLRGHTAFATCVAFSPDGRLLASSGWDETVIVWNADFGNQTAAWKAHQGFVFHLAFSPDGKLLASSGQDGKAKLWHTGDWQQAAALDHGQERKTVHALAFSPDGTRLATAAGHEVQVWDVVTGTLACTAAGPALVAVYSLAFHQDERRLFLGRADGRIQVWDLATGGPVGALAAHDDWVWCLAISPAGSRLASAGGDTACEWDLGTGRRVKALEGHQGTISGVAFSPDGRQLVTTSHDRTVRAWNAATGKQLAVICEDDLTKYGVAFVSTGERCFVGAGIKGRGGTWQTLLHQADGSWKWDGESSTHRLPVLAVAVSPDDRALVTCGEDGKVKVWNIRDTESFPQLGTLSHTLAVNAAAFSPDGRLLATASGDKTVKLWDTATWQERHTLYGHQGIAARVAFSADGRRLVSTDAEGAIKFWDAAAGQELATLYLLGPEDWALCAPDGRFDGTPGGLAHLSTTSGEVTTAIGTAAAGTAGLWALLWGA